MNLSLPHCFVLVLAAVPLTTHAFTPSQLFDKVKDSVVIVKSLDKEGGALAQGSGVVLPSGKVATNCHVVKDGTSFLVGRGGSLVTATLYAGDEDKDLCLLQTEIPVGTPAQIGEATTLKVGEAVYAIGAPKGLELSLSDGIVSQLRGGSPPLIQTTAAISLGSSGGGLFDSKGLLVGLTTLYSGDGQSLNFAMPVEWLADLKPGKSVVSKQRSLIDWITRAGELSEKQDWPGLLDWGKQWVKAAPDDAFAWFTIGTASELLQQFGQAIAAYRRVLRINPEDDVAWYNLGNSHLKLKNYEEAIAAYRQALEINPDNAKGWTKLGAANQHLKRRAEAISALREALKINSEDTESWSYLALAYHFSGNTPAALQAIKTLRTLDPAMAEKLFNIIVPR